MRERTVRVRNRLGIHARAAASIVQCAKKFHSEIGLERNGNRVNAKSILGIMMLAAAVGSEIVLRADGPDEAQAMEALVNLVASRFGELE